MSTQFQYDTLAVFGDSYADLGIVHDQTAGVLAFPYPFDILDYQQSFTNGAVWPEYSVGLLGVETSLNYAIGGAEVVGSQTLAEFIAIRGLTGIQVALPGDPALDYEFNLEGQIDRFLADTAGQDLSGTAAWLSIGLNDYLNYVLTDATPTAEEALPLIQSVVGATLSEAQRLVQAGVGEVFVTNLFPAAFLPFTSVLPPEIQGLAGAGFALHNDALAAGIAQLRAAGANVTLVDVETLAAEIIADPAAFGFVAPLNQFMALGVDATFQPVFNPALAGLDADQFAFWDAVHMTTAGHGILGAYQAAYVTSNVVTGTLGADDLAGSRDDDLILARAGHDAIAAEAGDDVVLAGLGDDEVAGGNGDDILNGGSGDDSITGGNGNDVVAGAAGDDLLRGGRGNDVLIGGLGSDMVFGDQGDDLFLFAEAALIGGAAGDADSFDGGEGYDRLFLALTEDTRTAIEAGGAIGGALSDVLGIAVTGIEEFVFVDSRLDLAAVAADARLGEADLWGLV